MTDRYNRALTDTPTQESQLLDPERASSDAILLAAAGYIQLLFFLPLWVGSREPFAKFHGRQSLVMFGAVLAFNIMVAVSDLVLGRILGSMFILGIFFKVVAWLIHYPAGFVVALAYAVLVVMGIAKAATGEYWRIPVAGVYAERLRI
ncbi:hypothetical protein JXD38_08865 [candidate division WOR-3 bacterium]|nr:hypothetical protein [candidate division WOR-3 bacterium]